MDYVLLLSYWMWRLVGRSVRSRIRPADSLLPLFAGTVSSLLVRLPYLLTTAWREGLLKAYRSNPFSLLFLSFFFLSFYFASSVHSPSPACLKALYSSIYPPSLPPQNGKLVSFPCISAVLSPPDSFFFSSPFFAPFPFALLSRFGFGTAEEKEEAKGT